MPDDLNSPLTAASATPRFAHLDALRGVAILGVMAAHSAEVVGVQGKVGLLASTGVRGVQLFYMVSAFTLLFSGQARKSERHPLLNFYLRRFFRIAPLFYLTIFLTWATWKILPESKDYSPPIDYFLAIFFLFGFKMSAISTIVGAGWSIAVETTFYAVLPVLRKVVLGLRSALLVYGLSLLLVTPLCYWLGRPVRSAHWNYFELLWFPVELPIFLLGMMVFYLWRLGVPSKTRLLSLCALLGGLGVILLNHVMAVPMALGRLPLDGVGVALILLAVTWHPWTLIVNRATLLLGKISYSLYLLHVVVIRLCGWALQRYVIAYASTGAVTLAYFVALLTVSVPVAILSYQWVEQPGILFGRALIARVEQRSALRAAHMPGVSSRLDTADGQF